MSVFWWFAGSDTMTFNIFSFLISSPSIKIAKCECHIAKQKTFCHQEGCDCWHGCWGVRTVHGFASWSHQSQNADGWKTCFGRKTAKVGICKNLNRITFLVLALVHVVLIIILYKLVLYCRCTYFVMEGMLSSLFSIEWCLLEVQYILCLWTNTCVQIIL